MIGVDAEPALLNQIIPVNHPKDAVGRDCPRVNVSSRFSVFLEFQIAGAHVDGFPVGLIMRGEGRRSVTGTHGRGSHEGERQRSDSSNAH
jgi:hypothetical protein